MLSIALLDSITRARCELKRNVIKKWDRTMSWSRATQTTEVLATSELKATHEDVELHVVAAWRIQGRRREEKILSLLKFAIIVHVRWTSVGLSMVQWANETEPQTDKDCECHQSPQFTESWSRKGTETALMMTPGLYVWICNTPRPFNSDPEFLPALFRSIEITLRWRGWRRLNRCRRQVNLIPS
jgi:hypothetical protein